MAESKRRVRKTVDKEVKDAGPKTKKSSRVKHAVSPLGTILRPLQPLFNFLGRILNRIVPRYFVNSWREVKRVSWPNRGETWRLTLAVFVFALIFGSLVAVVDHGLDELFKKVVLR